MPHRFRAAVNTGGDAPSSGPHDPGAMTPIVVRGEEQGYIHTGGPRFDSAVLQHSRQRGRSTHRADTTRDRNPRD